MSLPLVSTRFCLFCYKGVNSDVESTNNLESIKYFVKKLFRFVGGRECTANTELVEQNINEFRLNSELLNSCGECKIIIAEFSQVYHQLKFLELQLDLKLDELLGIIELSSKIPKRWTNVRKSLELTLDGNIGKIERKQSLITGIRQQITKSGVKRSASSYPRVLVERNSCDLNLHKQVVIKTEETLDQSTDEFNGTNAVDPTIKIEPEEIQSEICETDTRIPTAELTLSSKVVFEKCKICQKKFTPNGLEIHFTKCHDLNKVSNNHPIVKCKAEGCSAYFLTKRQLTLHRLQHIKRKKLGSILSTEYINGVKYFKCKICKTPFDKLQRLKRHLTTTICGKEEIDSGTLCTECQETFETKDKLWVHQSQVHSSNKRMVCTKCGKWFDRKWNFRMHLEYHKGPAEWKFGCENCSKKFASEQMLRRHAKSHQMNEPSLKNDLVVKQPNIVISTEMITSRKRVEEKQVHLNWRWQCKECGKRCSSKYKLNDHMRTHTGEKPHSCYLCQDVFSHAHSMRRHLKRKHRVVDDQTGNSSKNTAQISCEICGKTFGHRAVLMQHWLHHINENGESSLNTSDPVANADEVADSNLTMVETSDDLRDPLEILPYDMNNAALHDEIY